MTDQHGSTIADLFQDWADEVERQRDDDTAVDTIAMTIAVTPAATMEDIRHKETMANHYAAAGHVLTRSAAVDHETLQTHRHQRAAP